jgi:hypothetical protein
MCRADSGRKKEKGTWEQTVSLDTHIGHPGEGCTESGGKGLLQAVTVAAYDHLIGRHFEEGLHLPCVRPHF